jgi:hypothetical protein
MISILQEYFPIKALDITYLILLKELLEISLEKDLITILIICTVQLLMIEEF